MSSPTPEYYRRDQRDGISPPNLADQSTYAEHIVHARGIRTRYTSLSTDPATITIFGPQLWRLLQTKLNEGGHGVVSHATLIRALRKEAAEAPDLAARELASRALPRAQGRKEALVVWRFDTSKAKRKNLLTWAQQKVRPFFAKA